MATIRRNGCVQAKAEPQRPLNNAVRALLLVAAFSGGMLFGEIALAMRVF